MVVGATELNQIDDLPGSTPPGPAFLLDDLSDKDISPKKDHIPKAFNV